MPQNKNTSKEQLHDQLEKIFEQDPHLRPNPSMHDYQLTYPPAIQIERSEYQIYPDEELYKNLAVGSFNNSALYFHFGFCQYKCRYCHHYEIRPGAREELMETYVKAMLQEMRLFKQKTPQLRPLIYFLGGGTPTYLTLPLLKLFLEELLGLFGRPLTALSTVEVKPITATREKLLLLREAGFRRINLGVQTLDPELYAYHHYKEKVAVAYEAIDRARDCGFEFINIDILTGIEKQTEESWDLTLREIDNLIQNKKIDSVFIYPYHDDPRSKTFGVEGAIPSAMEVAWSEEKARKLFQKHKWGELGARFFRSPRHFRKEVLDLVRIRANPSYGELIYHGFGNSAFSVGEKACYLNQRSIQNYCEQVNQNKLGISHWYELDEFQCATRDITFDILYSPIVRIRSLQKKYGKPSMEGHLNKIRHWTKLGLGTWNPLLGYWRLSDLGKLVHLQMIPSLYLKEDSVVFQEVMERRKHSGFAYQGY